METVIALIEQTRKLGATESPKPDKSAESQPAPDLLIRHNVFSTLVSFTSFIGPGAVLVAGASTVRVTVPGLGSGLSQPCGNLGWGFQVCGLSRGVRNVDFCVKTLTLKVWQ